jgi:hypothetical protein
MPGRIRAAMGDVVGCVSLICIAAFGGEMIAWVISWL